MLFSKETDKMTSYSLKSFYTLFYLMIVLPLEALEKYLFWFDLWESWGCQTLPEWSPSLSDVWRSEQWFVSSLWSKTFALVNFLHNCIQDYLHSDLQKVILIGRIFIRMNNNKENCEPPKHTKRLMTENKSGEILPSYKLIFCKIYLKKLKLV